jgi:hypothetical protein
MNQVIIGNENTNDAQGTLLHSKNIGLRAHVKCLSAYNLGRKLRLDRRGNLMSFRTVEARVALPKPKLDPFNFVRTLSRGITAEDCRFNLPQANYSLA